MILSDLRVGAGNLERRTGWAVKPEGAWKGEVCVPLKQAHRLQPDNWTYKRQAWDLVSPGNRGPTAPTTGAG